MFKLTGRVVVYDLEFTAWEGSWQRRWSGPGEYRELVQIGAVALDADRELEETEMFDVLIKPRINPILSDYFLQLTGIDPAEVDKKGIDCASALAELATFVGSPTTKLLSYGPDYIVLRENCGLVGVPYPFGDDQALDIGPTICEGFGLDRASTESGRLPEILGFPAPGRKHQGLFDARAVAEALRLLRRRGGV